MAHAISVWHATFQNPLDDTAHLFAALRSLWDVRSSTRAHLSMQMALILAALTHLNQSEFHAEYANVKRAINALCHR
jgi:hypothetical protein